MRKLTLIDWKSSKALYREMEMQVSAYGRAYNIRAVAEKRPTVEALAVLRLDKETGLPEFHPCSKNEEANWRGFCGILDYYRAIVEPTITERSKDRFYINPDNEKEKGPSVTTILGCIDKPALVAWSANCCADYIRGNLEELRNPDTSHARIDQLLKQAKSAHRTESKKATDIGSVTHEAIETYLKGGDPEPIIRNFPKAQTAFIAFLEWRETVKLEPVALECKVFHPTLLFGGSFDCLAYLDLQDSIT